ncbi:prolipoprotein diacylglyceryl transferase, partial [bacterium]|nr:prolipoprotein diacylglyceryl transferase [bacterium]
RQGGLSIHGMLLFGIIFIFILAKVKKLNFLSLTDSAACAIPLAQAIGRWGNFFNSEAFGIPTNNQWGLFIPKNHRPEQYANTELFHPIFLYESVANIIIFIILLQIRRRKNLKSGTITFLYLIMYSFVRLILEGFRTDSVLNIGSIHIAQIVSLVIIAVCTSLLIFRTRN